LLTYLYVTGWCGHGFESHSQQFCADTPWSWSNLLFL